MRKRCLIIFYKNPELGKVKTRLAATVGDEMALAIYWKLASHTRNVVESVAVDKVVYYSHFVDREDNWSAQSFDKKLQQGEDLGERMSNAVAETFANEYNSTCIIGTDCFELNQQIVEDAFRKLETVDAVIGPAKDGGYYLLGMNMFMPSLFQGKEWSTSNVLDQTVSDLENIKATFAILPELSDVDLESDLPEEIRKQFAR